MNRRLYILICANVAIGAVLLMLCGCAGKRQPAKPPVTSNVAHRESIAQLAVITPRLMRVEWDFAFTNAGPNHRTNISFNVFTNGSPAYAGMRHMTNVGTNLSLTVPAAFARLFFTTKTTNHLTGLESGWSR